MKTINYALIGSGRLAQHLSFYLQPFAKSLSHWTQSKNSDHDLNRCVENSKFVLLAIKDDALKDFITKHKDLLSNKTLIHFSGSVVLPKAQSFHPLMTFTHKLYEEKFYSRIPFIGEEGKVSFRDIFPFWDNPYYEISSDQKSLYHSYCVISGNFTSLLWQKMFSEFKTQLSLPEEAIQPYQEKIFQNATEDLNNSLTGPFVRNDFKTINTHKKILEAQPELLKIYQSFEELYFNKRPL